MDGDGMPQVQVKDENAVDINELEWHPRASSVNRRGPKMVCLVCNNPDGPCMPKTRDCSFFVASLPVDFTESFTIPCYIKHKIDELYSEMDMMPTVKFGDHNHYYDFELSKLASKTSISGADWARFLKDFKMEASDLVAFDFEYKDTTMMQITPMNPKCKPKVFEKIEHPLSIEGVEEKHSLVVITKKLKLSAQNLYNWDEIVTYKGVGIGPLFVHKLTSTNVNGKNMKIPKKVVAALNKELRGHALLWGPKQNVATEAEYKPCADGRMVFSDVEWDEFVKAHSLTEGQCVMFLFFKHEKPLLANRYMHISVDVI